MRTGGTPVFSRELRLGWGTSAGAGTGDGMDSVPAAGFSELAAAGARSSARSATVGAWEDASSGGPPSSGGPFSTPDCVSGGPAVGGGAAGKTRGSSSAA